MMILLYIAIYWFASALSMIALREHRIASEMKNNQEVRHKPLIYVLLLAPLAFPFWVCFYLKNNNRVIEGIKEELDSVTEE